MKKTVLINNELHKSIKENNSSSISEFIETSMTHSLKFDHLAKTYHTDLDNLLSIAYNLLNDQLINGKIKFYSMGIDNCDSETLTLKKRKK